MRDQQLPATSKTRDHRLDLIKLVSCIAVVGLHTLRVEEDVICTIFYQLCAFAVPCFFMASGFVLLNRSAVGYRYSFRKILGIVRVVFLWHIICYFFQCIGILISDGWSWTRLLEQVARCVKDPLRSFLQKGPFWQFWYLGAMSLLYLLLPLLTRSGRGMDREKRLIWVWAVAYAVSLAVYVISLILGRAIQEGLTQTLRVWTWIGYFVLGGLMPSFVRWIQERISMKGHVLVLCLVTVVAGAERWSLDAYLFHVSKVEYYYDAVSTVLWVTLLFSCLMRLELRPWVNRLVTAATPLIMGVYIVHVQVRDGLMGIWTVDGTVERLVLAVVVSLTSFLVIHVLRKVPLGKYLIEI